MKQSKQILSIISNPPFVKVSFELQIISEISIHVCTQYSLARGKSLRATRTLSVFQSFYEALRHFDLIKLDIACSVRVSECFLSWSKWF